MTTALVVLGIVLGVAVIRWFGLLDEKWWW